MEQPSSYTATRRRPSVPLIVAILILHLAALYALARFLVPDTMGAFEQDIAQALTTVSVETPDQPDPPPAPPEPDEGAQGAPGQEATPRPVQVPEPAQTLSDPTPAPQATSTGRDNRSGARDEGAGTGAAGIGSGTGSGQGGTGSGNGVPRVAERPRFLSTSINDARDFPVPEGGRSTRFGTSVTVVVTVGTDGRATDCRVSDPNPDPEVNARICALVREKARWEPARDQFGDLIPAQAGYRQRFCAGSC
ncbi:hypothetical protein [Qipengyuania sp. JC766]|uniref:hypothetical protein n=1 Tax=Qipengyuania sp. JC766 TaxID=3232139 RepID=UPI0034599EC4